MRDMVERSRKNEVMLLYLRFFNILMSRKKIKQDETKVCVCVPCVFMDPLLSRF